MSIYDELNYILIEESPQNGILGLYKPSPPARTNRKSTTAVSVAIATLVQLNYN